MSTNSESDTVRSLVIDEEPQNARNWTYAEAPAEGMNDKIRVEFFHGFDLPYIHPQRLRNEIIAALPQFWLSCWKKWSREFPKGGGYSGMGGPYHQTLDLNGNPSAAQKVLGGVVQGYSILRILMDDMRESSDALRSVTGGELVTVLFYPPAFYSPGPWGMEGKVTETNFFPNTGPYFAIRYNVGSIADELHFQVLQIHSGIGYKMK
ncbi:hypothetical protein BJ508DRAFT_323923 [Ascobolus immersus RN42]|uniref:Uncharacterized protein n=1 Tax=Ascobolus immersus RN42 TaxID=1160509 RepID=A0A3N4IIE1_ASCIM|nr:hypothetical protein BJ508DRAFT_323923 [Ascobolus immersus RN42]